MSFNLGGHGKPSTAKRDCGMASAMDGMAIGRSRAFTGPGTRQGTAAPMGEDIHSGAFSDPELTEQVGLPPGLNPAPNKFPGR